jgi:hypothetical protein
MKKLQEADSHRLGQITDLEFWRTTGPVGLADLPDEPDDFRSDPVLLDINLPRVIDADEQGEIEDEIIIEQRADSSPPPFEATEPIPPDIEAIELDAEQETQAEDHNTQTTHAVIDFDDEDDEDDDPSEAPIPRYNTRSSNLGTRVVWDPRTGAPPASYMLHLILIICIEDAVLALTPSSCEPL